METCKDLKNIILVSVLVLVKISLPRFSLKKSKKPRIYRVYRDYKKLTENHKFTEIFEKKKRDLGKLPRIPITGAETQKRFRTNVGKPSRFKNERSTVRILNIFSLLI
jgi:hypothetical protein